MKIISGQSAIEYLMTYGWMLLVVAVAGGVIFSMTSESATIESVSGFQGDQLLVENYGFSSNQSTLSLQVRNTGAEPLTIENLGITINGETLSSGSLNQQIGVGDTKVVNLCGIESAPESNTGQLEFTVDSSSLNNIVIDGSISGGMKVRRNTITVGSGPSADYSDLQTATDKACNNEIVRIEPGVYNQNLTFQKDVIIEGDGAVLDGTGLSGVGINVEAGKDISPTIRDLEIRNFRDAIFTYAGQGDWTLENLTLHSNTEDGIDFYKTTGDWMVRDSVIRDNGEDGVNGKRSTGNWVVRNVAFSNNTYHINSVEAEGNWTVTNSDLSDSTSTNILATSSIYTGDATNNWWGRVSGPEASQYDGNVNVSNHCTDSTC